MHITKFGHCCLLIEENGLRIITDPGIFSTQQDDCTNIDIILITHEHPDHFHMDSVKALLAKNPDAKILTNRSVGMLLEKEQILFTLLEDGQRMEEKDVLIEGFGSKHALMHESIPQIQNVGYLIANRLFYPGDAFTNPGKDIEILALPVAGPWMKLGEAIDYALTMKPQKCFPVHEAVLKTPGSAHGIPTKVFAEKGLPFQILDIGTQYEF